MFLKGTQNLYTKQKVTKKMKTGCVMKYVNTKDVCNYERIVKASEKVFAKELVTKAKEDSEIEDVADAVYLHSVFFGSKTVILRFSRYATINKDTDDMNDNEIYAQVELTHEEVKKMLVQSYQKHLIEAQELAS